MIHLKVSFSKLGFTSLPNYPIPNNAKGKMLKKNDPHSLPDFTKTVNVIISPSQSPSSGHQGLARSSFLCKRDAPRDLRIEVFLENVHLQSFTAASSNFTGNCPTHTPENILENKFNKFSGKSKYSWCKLGRTLLQLSEFSLRLDLFSYRNPKLKIYSCLQHRKKIKGFLQMWVKCSEMYFGGK